MSGKPTVKASTKVFTDPDELQEYMDSADDCIQVDSFEELPPFVKEALREAMRNGQLTMNLDEASKTRLKEAGVTEEEIVQDLKKAAGIFDN